MFPAGGRHPEPGCPPRVATQPPGTGGGAARGSGLCRPSARGRVPFSCQRLPTLYSGPPLCSPRAPKVLGRSPGVREGFGKGLVHASEAKRCSGPSTFRTWRGAGRGNWPGTFSRSDAEERPGGLEGAPVAQALARLEPGLWRACFGKADPSPLAPAQCQEPGVETWVSAGRGLAMRRAPPLTCELPPGGA